MRISGPSRAQRVPNCTWDNLEGLKPLQKRVKRERKKEVVRYEGLPQGQLGHIQVPQGTLGAGDCDRGAN